MADVLSRGRWGTRGSWIAAVLGLAGLLLWTAPSTAVGQAAAGKAAAGKPAPAKAAPAETDKDRAPAAPDVDGGAAPDPSKTRRVAPVEVFKDPNAEAILDLAKLRPLAPAPVNDNDVARVEDMAGNPNLPIDRNLIDRVVRGLAANLTDAKSIKSLLEGPSEEAPKADTAKKGAPKKKPEGDGGKAIQAATTSLLRPIYVARAAKNDAFLRDYRRSLQLFLPPLLENHLIPRVQAMIVLGEAANPTPEGLTLFLSEIKNESQALWVKLWAIEGIGNIRKGGHRFTADQESRASKTVGEFLEKRKDLPWPIQMRGLETMGALRQGFLPTEAPRAHMANTAMLFLADPNARLEVRAEAARSLGLMQVAAVPRYNFRLIAYAAGQLAADVATEINNLYSDNPPKAQNQTKARYLTAMLVGQVYECFEGVQGENNSGIIQMGKADTESLKYIQKVFDLVRPMAQASVELLGAPTKGYKAGKQALNGRITALRAFLAQNPPPSRKLVPSGRDFAAGGEEAGAWAGPRAPAVAGLHRGR